MINLSMPMYTPTEPLKIKALLRPSEKQESRYRCHLVHVTTDLQDGTPKVMEFADVRLEMN